MLIVLYFANLALNSCLACKENSVAVFQLSLVTEWTRSRFPKQYPEFRPAAQWAPLIGESHSLNVTLWRENRRVSDGFRDYARDSITKGLLDRFEREEGAGVGDLFEAPSIPTGNGLTSLRFIGDHRHHMLSFAVRLVPSPDWFIGLDSQDLCQNASHWQSSFTVDLHPWDAGTDNGFTFTSPDFETEPRGPVTPITSKNPSHPASSFCYPHMKRLPRIAVVNIELIREDGRVKPGGHALELYDSLNRRNKATPMGSYRKNELEVPQYKRSLKARRKSRKVRKQEQQMLNAVAPDDHDTPTECVVSEWAEWSPCNKLCGIGESRRNRTIVLKPISGGAPCPVLEDRRRCGSFASCRRKHFDWGR
ncbi:spondin-2-like [Galendromus occidentalis]|uniref:Spondin-2-like n=1 Tax=Galendromus occidentalis TaxID=34638 RepID=A0AAJ7L8G4_9ACAR|nr:spondin-2-like [Galendromus occidentalis]